MSYVHTCYRDKRVGRKVHSLDKTDLDSFMPWAVTTHMLLEGGGSCLYRIKLFKTYDDALYCYQLKTSEPILRSGETVGKEQVRKAT